MISDKQQDQAVLYVLGELGAHEIDAFEAVLQTDAELRTLVMDLRETAAAVALTAPDRQPSPELRSRVLRQIAVETSRSVAGTNASSLSWLPWSIAALFLICSGVLLYERAHLRRELSEVRARDPFAEINFVTLAPQQNAPPQAKAMVAWEDARQTGIIRVNGLQPVPGKDYQLWAIDAAHRDPVSAGIVHVDANGVAEMRFTPIAATHQVKAFAISLEREGGVPKPQGPILLLGSTT